MLEIKFKEEIAGINTASSSNTPSNHEGIFYKLNYRRRQLREFQNIHNESII